MSEKPMESEIVQKLNEVEAAAAKLREEENVKRVGDRLVQGIKHEAGLAVTERKLRGVRDALRATTPEAVGQKNVSALKEDIDRIAENLKRGADNPPEDREEKE